MLFERDSADFCLTQLEKERKFRILGGFDIVKANTNSYTSELQINTFFKPVQPLEALEALPLYEAHLV